MAAVEKLGGSWVIVRGDDLDTEDQGSRSPAPRDTASSPTRKFWTGGAWAAQYGYAQQFATEEEADTCLAQLPRETH